MTFIVACLLLTTPQTKFELAAPDVPLIIVPVRLNGKTPLRFILDTGASASVVTHAAAKSIGLKLEGQATATGATGPTQFDLAKVDVVEVGGAEMKALTFAVGEMAEVAEHTGAVDGVLGYDFLRNFAVTIEYPSGVVRFERTGKNNNTKQSHARVK